MAYNKNGESQILTILVWVAIIGGALYLLNIGGFQAKVNGIFTNSDSGNNNGNVNLPTDTSNCNADKVTTYTINVQDALASTATSVYPEYLIFNGNMLVQEGTLSSSDKTVELTCGKDYSMLLVNTTTSSGAYGKIVDLQARLAQQTINEEIVRFGGAIINGIVNPSDTSAVGVQNMTLLASGNHDFNVVFRENVTEKGYNKPILMCQGNQTSIQNIALIGFSDNSGAVQGTPYTQAVKSVQANSGYIYYAWEYPKMMTQQTGPVTAKLNAQATNSAPAVGDGITCVVIDQADWKTSNYKTATSIDQAVKVGPENAETNSDIGAPASSTSTILFDARGY
jgi:hypothetical protein